MIFDTTPFILLLDVKLYDDPTKDAFRILELDSVSTRVPVPTALKAKSENVAVIGLEKFTPDLYLHK